MLNSPRPLAADECTRMERVQPSLVVLADLDEQVHPLFLLDAVRRLYIERTILADDLQ